MLMLGVGSNVINGIDIMLKRFVYGVLTALIFDAGFLYALYLWDVSSNMGLSLHAYIALGLGIFFTVLVGVALASLAFLSARMGVDEMAHDVEDKSNTENTGG